MERIKKSVKIGLLPAFAGRIKRKFYGHRSGDQRQRFLWGFECVFEESPPFVRIRILRIDGLAGWQCQDQDSQDWRISRMAVSGSGFSGLTDYQDSVQ